MINDNTILSSFDDKPTLLEWLKKVEDALKTDTATAVSVENPIANTYVFKITFADGTTLSSGNVVFPDSVKDVSIKNNHIIVTSVGGNVVDLGVLNPYAGTIVVNAETDTTEIGNNVSISGNAVMQGNLGVIGKAVVGGLLEVNSNESVKGGLSVEGALSAKGGIITAGKATANDGIEVHGQSVLDGNTGVTGNLGVTGNATIGGTITAGGKAIKAVEANPTDEATETLAKVKIGDVAYNVGGGGGSDYTAGSNIEISASKAIAVKNAMTGIDSIKFSPDNGCIINSGGDSSLTLKGGWEPYYSHPSIWLYPQDGKSYGNIQLIFSNKTNKRFGLDFNFATMKSGDSLYAFFLRGALPPRLPETDGTYILKASVSGGVVSYTWELQQ